MLDFLADFLVFEFENFMKVFNIFGGWKFFVFIVHYLMIQKFHLLINEIITLNQFVGVFLSLLHIKDFVFINCPTNFRIKGLIL